MTNETPHLNDDTCTDIAHGLLPRRDTEMLLEHVEQCPDCESLLMSVVADVEGAAGRARPVRGQDGGWQLPASRPSPRLKRMNPAAWFSTRPWHVAAAAAAVLVIVAVVMNPPRRPSDDAPLTFRLLPNTELLETRGNVEGIDAGFWSGVEAYDAGDFERAAASLADLDLPVPYNRLRDVYLASALTLVERYEEALNVLDALHIDRLPQPWRDDARWIRYIALESVGNEKEASALLESLANQPGRVGDLARERRASAGR